MEKTNAIQIMHSAGDIVAISSGEFDNAASTFYGNVMAAIKLRQKGTTMVSKLPGGVFRRMLEYKFPNELSFRYSEPCVPIENCKQDRHFPAIDKLSYDNYL